MINKQQKEDWDNVFPAKMAKEVRHYIQQRPSLITTWVADTWDEVAFIDYYEYGWFRVFEKFLELLR
jgi:hypothetical protein